MKKPLRKKIGAALLTGMLLVASALLAVADADDQYSDWGAPVNLGPTVNTTLFEIDSTISKDGLSLYFSSPRPGGFGGFDIWVSQRPGMDAPWGTPQNLGPNVNSSGNEFTPSLTIDGHRLYFTSNRPGGFGANDIYVSRRHNKRDDFAWRPAVNLGSGVNTDAAEGGPEHFEDDITGAVTLCFSSNRPGGLGAEDIYCSTLQPDETFGPAAPVPELNTPFDDVHPVMRRDGLEMFISSNRPGSFGDRDLWVSTRPSTSDPWSTPVNLGPVVNSAALDARPALSFDGTALYFQSTRPGGFGTRDLYVTMRTKLKQPE
jgi:hypothetical protein